MSKHTIDEAALRELIAESQDLQTDALRQSRALLPDLEELAPLSKQMSTPARAVEYANHRRAFLRTSGIAAAFGAAGVFAGGVGGALTSILSPRPAFAQAGEVNVDVQILQTAASLENLAVATYKAALGLPFIANGNPVVKTFAMTTMDQHAQHGAVFNAEAKKLGGAEQKNPNPALAPTVEKQKPDLKTPADVVKLAAMLETVATQTYLSNMPMFGSAELRLVMGSVMGVEAQHLATLRAVDALLAGGKADLIAIPTKPAELPAAAGSVSFPEPFEQLDEAREPSEGAVK